MSKSEYKHQCRYCAYCVFTMEETHWCDELNMNISRPHRPNSCKSFLFNPISCEDLGKVYKPRNKRHRVQMKQMKIQF